MNERSIKIDRSFISQATRDRDAAAVVSSVIAMAHELGLQAVAEGVETEDQERFLVAHGCDLLQGFLHSPPLPAEECERWLRQRINRPLTSIPGGAGNSRAPRTYHAGHLPATARRRLAGGARA